MSTDKKSEFLDIQENICETIPAPELPSVICPTCVPDKSAIVPNWWEEPEPFLDSSTCMYSITVAINDEGESYDVAKMTSQGWNIKQLIETYKRFGLLQLMRFYNKEISNQTLFAFPDNPEKLERLNQSANKKIENSVEVLEQQLPNGIFSVYGIPGPILDTFGIKEGDNFNPYAAELYVKANDYYISPYQTATGGEPILVQVTIPAFIFDRIPKAKPVPVANIQKEIVLDGLNLKAQIKRLQIAMGVFGKYQAYWWQTEKGRLVFRKTLTSDQDLAAEDAFENMQGIKDFYCTLYGNKLDSFVEKLESLIEGQTRFRFRRRGKLAPRAVQFIKISFDNSDSERPYLIKKIEVKGLGCDYERVPLGSIRKLTVNDDDTQFIYPFNDQTLLGYVANIDKIDQDLQAKETPPWVDFCLEYTFPPLSIEYGKENDLTSDFGEPETILGCVIDNVGGADAIRDFFLEQIITFFDAIAYKWNQNNCKALAGTYVTRQEQIEKGAKQNSAEKQQQSISEASAQYDDEIQDKQKEIAETNKIIDHYEEQLEFLEKEIESRLTDPDVAVDDPTFSLEELYKHKTEFEEQIESAKWLIEEEKKQLGEIEKERRNAVQSARTEGRKDFNNQLRQDKREEREQRSEIKDSLNETKVSRKDMKSLRKDAREIGLSRKESRQLANAVQDMQNLESSVMEEELGSRRENRLDRRQQKGERLGSDPFVAAAREAVTEQFPFQDSLISLFLSEEDFEQYGLRGFDFRGGLRDMSNGIRGEEKGQRLKNFISRIGLCGFSKLGQKALKCLLGGVDLDTGLRAIIQAALNNMAPNYMERLLIGLDPRVQEDIRKQVEKTFGSMPAPWETGYDPGSVTPSFSGETREGAYDTAVDSIQTKIDNLQEVIDSLSSIGIGLPGFDEEAGLPAEYTKQEIIENVETVELTFESSADLSKVISFVNNMTFPIGKLRLDSLLNEQLKPELELDLAALEAELTQTLLDADNIKFSQWNSLTQEEQDELRAREREIADQFANGAPQNERVNQGSIGKALGSIQQEVFAAYVEAIMDNVEIQELFSILDKIPGAKLVARLIASFDCPNVHFIYPPIKSFLGSLTFDDCLDRGRVTFPRISRIPKIKTIKEYLMDLARWAKNEAWSMLKEQVWAAATLKVLLLLENALCKSLEAVGQFAAEATLGSEANFGNVINELFCGSANEGDMDEVSATLLSSIGVTPKKLADLSKEINATDLKGEYKQVMNSISNVVTGDQLRELFVANPGEADLNVLARVSRTVTTQCPSFGIFFDSPDKVATIFAAMGNFMSPEQREKVRNDLANPIVVVDSNQSICLTQEQLQEYEDKLRATWANCGLSPDTIEEIIIKDKDKNQKEVFEAAERLAKGPAGIFKDAIDKALLPEECGDVNGINSFETPLVAQEASILTEGVFKSLQRTYSKDMVGKKHSFLENVLADTTDLPLKRHERRVNSESFYIDYANSAEDWELKEKRFKQTAAGSFYFGALSQEEPKGIFPDTVAIKMKEEFDIQTYDVNFTYIPIELPRKETKSVRVGLLGREKDIEIPKPYIKMPDLTMTFDNSKDYRSDFDIDLSYTRYKEGQVKIEKDFGYKVNIKRTTIMTEVDIETEEETERISTERVYGVFSPQQIDQSASVLLAQYDVSEEELNQKKIPYQSYILANFVNSQLQSASHPPISPIEFSKDFYANFINKSFDVLSKGLLTKLDGEISDGFLFGYESDPLSTDDLLYVDPESDPNDESTWEYTFEEEDGVLGRSATNNSRVHFLDPNMYGGKFRSPPLYIEPSTYSGWLGLSQMLVPEIDGCKPKRTDFIDIKQISENVRKVQTSIPQDPRLKEDPECVKRIPFDKISDPATLAFIDGTVIATIRTYASEAMLKSMPMLSFLEYSDTNYDDGYAQLIVKEMEEQMPLEDAIFGGRIEGYTYWLLFLEQAVQSAVRKIDNGEIKSTPEIEAARKAINDAQTSYIYPQKKDLETFIELKELGQKQIATAGALSSITLGFFALAFPAFIATSAIIAAPIAITTLFVTLNDLRFASKIGLIESVKHPCKVLLKALVDNELKFLSSKLEGDDRFRPYVADLSKYYLSLPDFMYGSTLKAGLMDIEKPQVVGELDMNYGDITEVSPQPTLTDKLIELGLTSDQLSSVAEQGGLFIEKYIRTIDKPRQGPSLQNETREDQQEPPYLQIIRQRPETLRGVCNITEFRQWASVAKEQIPNELNISDLFGDAFVPTGTTGNYEGSIGLKFGIRISLVPNEALKANLATGNWDAEVVAREKSYSFADTSVVPLVTYERDIKDIKFVDLDFEDSNLGEDLKCYVDKMVSTEDYRLVMDYMFGLRRVPTIMSIYMNHSFVASVGASQSERDDDAKLLGFIDRTSDEWKSVILDDTKSECRRLFASFYRSDDFNPQDDNDASLREVVSRFLPGIFGVNRLLVHWTTRKRLRNRPFDKDGKLCKNAFQRVFSPD